VAELADALDLGDSISPQKAIEKPLFFTGAFSFSAIGVPQNPCITIVNPALELTKVFLDTGGQIVIVVY
jgi:hypothetical protein